MTNPKLLRGRCSQPGACYVVTSVTEGRRPLFRDPRHARCVIDEIAGAAESVETLAWVVMPDHMHWSLSLRCHALGSVVQAMKSRSARAINSLLGTGGRVWQNGYYDHRLRSDEDMRRHARYIVANPLRAGLAETLAGYPFWWCKWINREQDL